MIRIIRGPFRSGKTTKIMDAVRKEMDASKFPMVLVPTRILCDNMTSAISLSRKTGYAGKAVFTLEEAVRTVIHSSGENIISISGFESFILLKLIMEENTESLLYFRNLESGGGMVRLLYSAVNELRAAALSGNKKTVYENSDPQNLSDKMKDVFFIYRLYEEKLRERGLHDSYSLFWKASEIIETRSVFHASLLVLDGFVDFTETQYGFVRSLITSFEKEGKDVILTLPDLPFDWIQETLDRFVRDFDVQEERIDYVPAGITGFVRSWMAGKKEPGAGILGLEILTGFGKYREAERIANRIQKLVVAEGYRYSEIAVILRKPEMMIRHFWSIFRNLGIPFYSSSDEPLEENPAVLFVYRLLSAALRDQSIDNIGILEFAGSSYTANHSIRQLSAILESFQGYFRGNSKQWKREAENRLEFYAEKRSAAFNDEETGLDAEDYNRKYLQLKKLIPPLNTLLDLLFGLSETFTMNEFLQWFSKLIEDFGIRECLNQGRNDLGGRDYVAFRKLNDALFSLKKTLVFYGKEKFRKKEFFHLFDSLIRDITYRHQYYPLEAVRILTPFDARESGFRAVFIASLCEGEFPGNPSLSIFDRSEKKKLNSLARSRIFEEEEKRFSSEKFDFCMSASRADELLVLSYTPFDESGRDILPSIFLSGMAEKAGIKPEDSNNEQLFEIIPSQSWMDLFDLNLLVMGDYDLLEADDKNLLTARFPTIPETEKMRSYFGEVEKVNRFYEDIQTGTGFQTKPQSLALRYFGGLGLDDNGLDDLSNRDFLLKQLKKMVFSSSRLEVFGNCRMAFFFHYVLGISEESYPSQEIEANYKGSFYHAVLKAYADETKDWTSQDILSRLNNSLTALDRIFDRTYLEFRNKEMGPSLFSIEKEFYRKVLRQFIRFDAETLRNEARPLEMEKALSGEIPIGNEKLSIRGSIDRVDEISGGRKRIIDYKSGSVDYIRDSLKIPLKVFQGFLYARALENLIGEIQYVSIEKRKTACALPLRFSKTAIVTDFHEIWTQKEKEIARIFELIREGNFSPYSVKADFPDDLLEFYERFSGEEAIQLESNKKCVFCSYQKACLRSEKLKSEW